MKVFFSSELMVWLSLTLGAGAASLVPCGKIRTGVVQSYTSCTFLICLGQTGPWGEWSGLLLFLLGLCWAFVFQTTIPTLFSWFGNHICRTFVSGIQISRLSSGIHISDGWSFISLTIYLCVCTCVIVVLRMENDGKCCLVKTITKSLVTLKPMCSVCAVSISSQCRLCLGWMFQLCPSGVLLIRSGSSPLCWPVLNGCHISGNRALSALSCCLHGNGITSRLFLHNSLLGAGKHQRWAQWMWRDRYFAEPAASSVTRGSLRPFSSGIC